LEEEFAEGVHAAVVECYVIHSKISAAFTQEIKDEILGMVGALLRNLHEVHELKQREAREGSSDFLILQIEGKRGEIRENLEALPSMEFLDELSLEPSPDIFLETLILCIKNYAQRN